MIFSSQTYGLTGIFILLLFTACDDSRTGLDVEVPDDPDFTWNYSMRSYFNNDTTDIGTVTVENVETLSAFEGRVGILRQRVIRRVDSLQNSPDSAIARSFFLDQQSSFRISLFADNFFDLFQTMLTRSVLDTIVTDLANGPEFQEFIDFSPRWSPIAEFDENATSNFEVHRPVTVFFNFHIRDYELIGSADVETTGVFAGFETINTSVADSLETIKIRNTTTFDFNLQKISPQNDTTDVRDFRISLDMETWYSQEFGVLRKDRKPFELFVPSIPSRFPSILDPGEIWELQAVEGFSF